MLKKTKTQKVNWDMFQEVHTEPQCLLEKLAKRGAYRATQEERSYIKQLSDKELLEYLKERYKDAILEGI